MKASQSPPSDSLKPNTLVINCSCTALALPYTQVYKMESDFTHRWMGNRTCCCIYNTLMQYRAGTLAIAFTAPAPQDLFQEELWATAGYCAGCHPSSGKMKVFPAPSTSFIFFLPPPPPQPSTCTQLCFWACLFLQMQQFTNLWDKNVSFWFFYFFPPNFFSSSRLLFMFKKILSELQSGLNHDLPDSTQFGTEIESFTYTAYLCTQGVSFFFLSVSLIWYNPGNLPELDRDIKAVLGFNSGL